MEIIESVRKLNMLVKILLSKEQINLLTFENSSLLKESNGRWREF